MTQTIYGVTGQYNWLRKRVWWWQRRAFEASGWTKSPREGHIRPMMIKRVDLQREKNKFMRDALRSVQPWTG